MKKLLLMASAICMGLLSGIDVANATHSGRSACAFDTRLIKKAGFVSGSYYDSATVRQLLSRINVSPTACTNVPSCQYRYMCSEYHYSASNRLVPSQGPAIYWQTSQPF